MGDSAVVSRAELRRDERHSLDASFAVREVREVHANMGKGGKIIS